MQEYHRVEATQEKEKAVEISLNGLYLCRRRPTLPHTFACSTIGPAGLNFRVRDGNGWIPRGKITDVLSSESLGPNSPATSSCNLVKDLEDNPSQLNRLV